MSDELRVPGYVNGRLPIEVAERLHEIVKGAEPLALSPTAKYVLNVREAMTTQEVMMITEAWRVLAPGTILIPVNGGHLEEIDAAAQRAYSAFWGVLGPVSEQWAVMSEERKDCWRGVVRAVLDV